MDRSGAPLIIDDVREALSQSHGPVPGPLWQRNHRTGLLHNTCVCGDVLAIKEEYTYIETSWARTRNLKDAGMAWANHRRDKTVAAVMALVPKIKAEALREAADGQDADPEFRDPLRLKSEWLRDRADRIESEAGKQ